MISFIKKRAAIQQESKRLIALVHAGLPVGNEHHIHRDRLTNKSATALRQVAGSASRFARTHKAGMFSKSYLANCVRWGLKDLGYSDDFVDTVTGSIVMAMEHAAGE